MTATARIVAVADADGNGNAVTRLPVLSSQVPLVLRRTPDAVYLVGGAAGPLGGDDLTLTIEVGDGAALRVRTAAASVALPGATGAESVLRVHATVGAGARLEYLPEPVVIADGARHRGELRVSLAADATLLAREEVILGRHGERGGECVTRILVDLDGTPLLRQEVAVNGTDPTGLGPAVLAGHRAFGSLVIVGNGQHLPGMAGQGVAAMPLAGPGILVTAVAHDARDLRALLQGTLEHGTATSLSPFAPARWPLLAHRGSACRRAEDLSGRDHGLWGSRGARFQAEAEPGPAGGRGNTAYRGTRPLSWQRRPARRYPAVQPTTEENL